MPVVDMPLEKLKEYRGSSPRPKDFDAFWDKGIREMEALGTNCTLKPSSFQIPNVECFDLTFIGLGGAKIHAKFAKPKKIERKCPAVLRFHGYSLSSGDFWMILPYVAAGFCVAAMDCRGQGGISEDSGRVKGNTLHGHIIRGLDDEPEKLYYRNVFLDTAQLARIVMAMDFVDETRVGAFGGSQGGGLTLACAALTPNLNRCAPMMSFLCDYKRVWNMDMDVNAYEEIREYFRHSDPLHEREEEIFTKLGYIDNVNLAPKIRAKVLYFTALLDNVCPPSTQFAAYNAIRSEKEMVIYPDFKHETYPGANDRILMYMSEMLENA